ncbi:hypothetical protein BJV82DRAFT_526121, partial [Fennellomyces sp. T-0311]
SSNKRRYVEAMANACGEEDNSRKEQKKMARIIQSLQLQPFAIHKEAGNKENALAHPDVIARLTDAHKNIHSILPKKQPLAEEPNALCVKCVPKVPNALENIFLSSPYSTLLEQREYVPLTEDICAQMNIDWSLRPQAKYFTAAVLAGCTLYNTNSGQALMVNTIEVYGRTKSVDPHCEAFGKLKNTIRDTSLPPPIPTFHSNVWPTAIHSRDGKKLVVGTLVSNGLVTSSMRLDKKLAPSVGAVTTHFSLNSLEDSLATQIFLDQESLSAAMKMIDNTSVSRVSVIGIATNQIRQLRSLYHELSTYTLCRASGALVKNHTCQPYTLFMLSKFDSSRTPYAKIFSTIAREVLVNGNNAKLLKKDAVEWKLSAKGKSKSQDVLQKIVQQFGKNKQEIPIISNTLLNTQLEKLAEILMPSIILANRTVELHIEQAFSFYD